MESYRNWKKGCRGKKVYKIINDVLIKLCKYYYPDNEILKNLAPTSINQNQGVLDALGVQPNIKNEASKSDEMRDDSNNSKSELEE